MYECVTETRGEGVDERASEQGVDRESEQSYDILRRSMICERIPGPKMLGWPRVFIVTVCILISRLFLWA